MTTTMSATFNLGLNATPSAGFTKAADAMRGMANDAERTVKATKTAAGGMRRSGANLPSGDGDGEGSKTYRTQRSTAGSRGAAGRNFAGLAQASGDTSGFVAAYATVAANVFALTAAFKALSDAAKFVQLQKGLELVGAQAGSTLSITARKMEELSGFAISTVESMKAVASATAAGFSGKEIERLTKVAKGASVALGRDMSDSIDRLTRGTIKLEPELLDELGIMTRLDEATRTYALTHKIAASSLTNTQRRQAFLNAVLAEGEQKFGSIADSVDVSPYDKLAAGVKKLGTQSFASLNKFLNPLLDVLIKIPALGLIPLAGIMGGALGKLIPDMSKNLEKLNEKWAGFSTGSQKAILDLQKFKDKNVSASNWNNASIFRQAEINGKKNKYLNDDATIVGLGKSRNIALREEYNLIKQISTATSAELPALERKLALTREVSANLLAQRDATIAQARFTSVANSAKQDTRIARRARQSQEILANDLYNAGGDTFAKIGAVGKSFGRDLHEIGREFGIAKKNQEDLNKGMKGGARWMQIMSEYAAGIGGSFKVMPRLLNTIVQGVQVLAGALITAFAIIQIGMAIWPWVEETFLGITKRAKELKQELGDMVENATKTAVEIRKFQEIGLFGKAIDASSNSMTELFNKTKEYNDELKRGKSISVENTNFGILNQTAEQGVSNIYANPYTGRPYKGTTTVDGKINLKDSLKSSGISDDLIKLTGATGDLLTPFGNKLQETFVTRIKELANDPDGLAEYLLQIQGKFGDSLGAMADFDAGAKELGKTLVKLRTPDVFTTTYTPVLDQIKGIDSSYKIIMKTFGALESQGAEASKAFSGLGKSMSVSYESIAEIDRLLGGNTGIFEKYAKRAEAAAKLASEKLKDNNSYGISSAQLELDKTEEAIGRIFSKSIAINAEFENSKIVLDQTALEGLKLQDSFASLVADSMKFRNSMKSINKEMDLLDKTGSSEKGIFGSAVAQVEAAKETRDIAIQTSSIKIAVINAEYDLLEAQRQLAIIAQKDKLSSPELSKAATYAKMYASYNDIVSNPNITPEEFETAKRYLNVIELLNDQEKTRESIRRQSIANIGSANALAQKQVDLEFKKLEAYINTENVEKRRLDIVKEQIDADKTLLGLQKDLFSSQQTLDKLSLESKAFKNNMPVSAQDTYKLEQQKLAKEIEFTKTEGELLLREHDIKMDLYKAEFDLNKIRLAVAMGELDKQIDDPKSSPDTVRNALYAKTIGYQYENDLNNAMNRFTQSSSDQRSLIVQNNTAKVAVATAISEALKDPISVFLNEWATKANLLKTNSNGAGWIGLFDSKTASTAQTMREDPNSAGLSKEAIQKQAIAFELANAQATFFDDTMVSIGSHTATAFQSILDGTVKSKDAFKTMASSIIGDIGSMITRMLTLRMLSSIFGAPASAPVDHLSFLNSLAGVEGKAAGGILPMASGGVMDRARSPQGIIKQPTYLIGEGKMNEAVVPLPNGRAIPVQMHGSNTASNNVQVNVHMNGQGDTKSDKQGADMNNLGAAIAQAVQKELLAQKAPGGILNRYGAA